MSHLAPPMPASGPMAELKAAVDAWPPGRREEVVAALKNFTAGTPIQD